MVNEVERGRRIVYVCEICGLGYLDIETAERYEQHCYTHGSCSLPITRKAIYKPKWRTTLMIAADGTQTQLLMESRHHR